MTRWKVLSAPLLVSIAGGCGCSAENGAAEARTYACEADLALIGFATNDHQGFSLGSLGPNGSADWNGDGIPELLVGSYQKIDVPNPNDRKPGSITLHLSPFAWEHRRASAREQVQIRVVGDKGARFGRSVAWLGDLDGDGRDDFAVGDIRGPRLNENVWSQRGRVYVFLSADAGTGLRGARKASGRAEAYNASAIVLGAEPGHRFGHALAGIGDHDGDGTPDLLVGAPGTIYLEDFPGRAYVLSGAKIVAAAAGEELVAVDDLAIWSAAGEGGLDAFGFSVARLESGFAVGAPQMMLDASLGLNPDRSATYSGAGYVRVFAPDGENTLKGEATGDMFGFAVGGGDFGIAVGAPGCSFPGADRAGRLVIARAAGDELARHDGERPLEMLGWTAIGLGDVNRDGADEYAAGSLSYSIVPPAEPEPYPCDLIRPQRPLGGLGAGRALVFDGATHARVFEVVGETTGDSAGAVLARLGDLDRSGGDELVFSVFRWDEPQPRTDVGKVCVFRDFLAP